METLQSSVVYCNETIDLKKTIEKDFLELGARLKIIRDQKLYKPQWENFGYYVEEMKMSEATASKLINIFNKFIIEYEIDKEELLKAGGWSTAAELLPVIKDRENALEWLGKAEVLTRQHLRQEIDEAKTGIEIKDCLHDFYTLKICRNCNLKEKII